MARATKASRVKDAETAKVIAEIGASIESTLKGEFFEVDGCPTATVKYKEGGFKKKPLVAGWSMSLSYVYVGATGGLIFGFTPEDEQEYQYVELSERDVDTVLPLFGGHVAKAFNLDEEDIKTVISLEIAKRLHAKANEKDDERKRLEEALQNNSLFGAF